MLLFGVLWVLMLLQSVPSPKLGMLWFLLSGDPSPKGALSCDAEVIRRGFAWLLSVEVVAVVVPSQLVVGAAVGGFLVCVC